MDTESLTYRELAQRLDVKLESARKTVMRKRWQKITGNDGTVRIQVPIEALPLPVVSPPDSPSDNQSDSPAVYTRELEVRIEGLHMLLAAESRRAETAEMQAGHWQRQADHWQHQAAELLANRQRPRGLLGFLKRAG